MNRSVFRLLELSHCKSGSRIALAMALSCGIATQANAALQHQYLFNSGNGTEVLDSVGTAHGTALDTATVNTADSFLSLNGTGGYATLPGADIAVNTYGEVSLEMWLSVAPSTSGFTMAAGLGRTSDGSNEENDTNGYDYLMLQATRGNSISGSRAAISNGNYSNEVGVDDSNNLTDGLLHHLVLTVDSTDVTYYVDGASVGTSPLGTLSLANVSNDLAYIGRSLYADPFFGGSVFEYSIYDDALDAAEVQGKFTSGCVAGCGEPLRLEVNRDTGAAQLLNDLSEQGMVSYTITSAAGALDTVNWDSITSSGIDPDDDWAILSQTSMELSENDPLGGGGPDDGVAITQSSPVPLGELWVKSPFEDLVAEVTVYDGFAESTFTIPVSYVGNGDQAFSRSDLNLDGNIDGTDYGVLLANHLTMLTGTSAIETFVFGDIDGDLDNDFNDFRLFQEDFIAENGLAAFLALGATVPEPTTLGLMVLGMTALASRRRSC